MMWVCCGDGTTVIVVGAFLFFICILFLFAFLVFQSTRLVLILLKKKMQSFHFVMCPTCWQQISNWNDILWLIPKFPSFNPWQSLTYPSWHFHNAFICIANNTKKMLTPQFGRRHMHTCSYSRQRRCTPIFIFNTLFWCPCFIVYEKNMFFYIYISSQKMHSFHRVNVAITTNFRSTLFESNDKAWVSWNIYKFSF